MIVAFLLSVTLLPALLKLLNLGREEAEVGFAWMAPADAFLIKHRRHVVQTAAVAGVICLGLMTLVRFDSDPINLRSPKAESVSTLRDLMKNPQTSPNTIDIAQPSLAAADALAAKVSKLPEVGQTITLTSFVPEDQDKKLAMIADTNNLIGATIAPFEIAPAPSDGEITASLARTAAKLRDATKDNSAPSQDARRLAAALDAVTKAGPAARARATEALVPGLQTMLLTVATSLTAEKVTVETMPAEMRRDWVSANGVARIQVSPKDTRNDPSKEDLDEWIAVLAHVLEEGRRDPELVRTAPHNQVVAQIDGSGLDNPDMWAVTWAAYRRKHLQG